MEEEKKLCNNTCGATSGHICGATSGHICGATSGHICGATSGHICGATRGATSSQFIRQKLLVSLFLEREKIKEKNKKFEIKEDMCSKNIREHLHSECCITVDPNDSSLENCIITTCCLPFKIVLCFPCHIGVVINSILNCLCNTDKNYLI
jgi:hypothetical protein